MKPIGYIYLTTCIVNGKIYVGKHELNGIANYIGSGRLFTRAVRKYGKDKFKKKILRLCYTLHELRVWEHVYIVKYNATDRSVGYNIAKGDVNTTEFNPAKLPEVREKIRKAVKERGNLEGENNPNFGNKWSEKQRKHLSKALKRTYKINGHPRIGSHHKKSSKEIMRKKKLGIYLGQNNPMYGSRFTWINNGERNKRLNINEPIPEGWEKGIIFKGK